MVKFGRAEMHFSNNEPGEFLRWNIPSADDTFLQNLIKTGLIEGMSVTKVHERFFPRHRFETVTVMLNKYIKQKEAELACNNSSIDSGAVQEVKPKNNLNGQDSDDDSSCLSKDSEVVQKIERLFDLDKLHPIAGSQLPSLNNWYETKVPCFWKLGEYLDEDLHWCLILEVTPPHIPPENCTFYLEEDGMTVGGTFILPRLIVNTDFQNGYHCARPRTISQKAVSKALMGGEYGLDTFAIPMKPIKLPFPVHDKVTGKTGNLSVTPKHGCGAVVFQIDLIEKNATILSLCSPQSEYFDCDQDGDRGKDLTKDFATLQLDGTQSET